jgi:hypothetical protein
MNFFFVKLQLHRKLAYGLAGLAEFFFRVMQDLALTSIFQTFKAGF